MNQDQATISNNGSSSSTSENHESAGLKRPPGIDNSDLIYDVASDDSNRGDELHDTLVEGRDYILLPQEVWKQLYLW